jgi:P-type Cu2+ transporter
MQRRPVKRWKNTLGTAFVYSLAALLVLRASGFFWELATLVDVMLLGHWLEMRSVRQASGALNELAKLMPDIAERMLPDGSTERVRAAELQKGDRVPVSLSTIIVAINAQLLRGRRLGA